MTDNKLLQFKIREYALKRQLIRECRSIEMTVEWLGKEIDKKLLEIEEAERNNDYKGLDLLQKQAIHYLFKLNKENENMDLVMAKYKRIFENEKKGLLSLIGTEDTFSIRGVPTNTGWLSTGTFASGQA